MAHKKGMGSSDNGRDSKSKRLGVKLFGGQVAKAGNIIIRQRGTKFHAGDNVYLSKDFSIHAKVDGTVEFKRGYKNRVFVSIQPFTEIAETVAKVEKSKPAAPKAEAPKPTPEPAAPAPEIIAETAPAATEEAAPKKAAAPKATSSGKDDLKKVEGIGPKIESLLNDAGILTFVELSETDPEKIKEILEAAGNRYKMHDPTTWPQQAKLAADGNWDELSQMQDDLKGGRK